MANVFVHLDLLEILREAVKWRVNATMILIVKVQKFVSSLAKLYASVWKGAANCSVAPMLCVLLTTIDRPVSAWMVMWEIQ